MHTLNDDLNQGRNQCTKQRLDQASSYGLRMILVVLLVALAGSCAKAPEPVLRVATIPWPGYETLHLAQSLDYFEPIQIRLVEFVNSTQATSAILNGTVHAAALTLDEVLVLMQDGVDLKAILVMDISDGADAVMARPEITTLQALRGKRIGVETGAIGALMFDAMLTAAGLSVTDVVLVETSFNEAEQAYLSGKLDAVVTFEPVRTQLLAAGAHVLFDSRKIPGRVVDVLAVRAEALRSHPKALCHLVRAHFSALDYLAVQPSDAAMRLAPLLKVSPAKVLPLFGGLKIPNRAENRAQLAGTEPHLTIAARVLADFMLSRDLLHSPINLGHLAEPLCVPELTK